MDLRELPDTDQPRHPWETARAAFFTKILLENLGPVRPVRVLDIGSGDGFLARHLLAQLPPRSAITCVDSNYDDAWLRSEELGQDRRLRFAREIPGPRYDWVLLLDVLEHVSDDRGMLRDSVGPALETGGKLLISVPAWPSLYTDHDVRLGHVRRYTARQLERLLDETGFTPRVVAGLFGSLLLPRSLSKLSELLRGRHSAPPTGELQGHITTDTGSWSWPTFPTRIVEGALRLDAALGYAAARTSLLIPGLSVWTLAEHR